MGHGLGRRLTRVFTATALGAILTATTSADLAHATLSRVPETRLTPLLNTASLPRLSDDQLLDAVQRQTLRYFWDFADPVSGMARERTNGDAAYGKQIVATGGTGFGIMSMIAGANRGWLPREEVRQRLEKIMNFVDGRADKFHGFLPHFIDPDTGHAFALNPKDDGADIVETSYFLAGLLTARQYFNSDTLAERELRTRIDKFWQGCDWQFQTRGGDSLYWHWSPTQGWAMNMPIRGPNEAMITYILAAASPTHPIAPEVYEHGFARDGVAAKSDNLTHDPLFFVHYSYLGLDPRGLSDRFGDYGAINNNLVHAQIEHARTAGDAKDWGLTSGDGPDGYHEYTIATDAGVIGPTAAVSSLPYAPKEAMAALRHYFEDFHGQLWGPYGFRDSFAPATGWIADTNLAIDQGPEGVMIENYRSGLLWSLFMSAPDVQDGLRRLGFSSPYLNAQNGPPPAPGVT